MFGVPIKFALVQRQRFLVQLWCQGSLWNGFAGNDQVDATVICGHQDLH
ncbi:Uncharacterised protein [Shigella sonnei]|nr:Uncharacterised protein [Shigella sonnei]CSS96811.1 Uncharacterised protein [Shigella sonnei]